MTTLMNWLLVLMALCLSAAAILAMVLNHLTQTRWMKIFCEMRGIPSDIMDTNPAPKEEAKPKIDKRQRMSIPIPGADMFRKPQ